MPEILSDRLSLVVGITGHRDVAANDEAPLRAAFAGVLDELSQACPHTPLLVICGLAAGADTLAAEEAHARNIPILACLPMPIEEYEKDFSPAQLARFHSLLAASSRVTIASPTRENGYLATGRFIAQYSHLLVAFWDMQSSRGAGGTADVVAMRMTGETETAEVEEIPYLPDIGPVEVIVTPRGSAARPANAYARQRLYPKPLRRNQSVAKTYDAILARIDTYNLDLSRSRGDAERGLQRIMERTDAVANRLQAITWRYQFFLYVAALLAATVQVLGVASLAKLVALGVAFGAYRIARGHDYENRYQDYRAIAEGLRVQSAWYCAGLTRRLVDTAYLSMQTDELQWIRMALRFFYLLYCEDRESEDASHDHPVCRDWVQSQWRYYYRACRREAGCQRRLDAIARVAIGIGVLSLVASTITLAVLFPHSWSCAFLPCGRGFAPSRLFELSKDLLTVPVVFAAMLAAVFSHHVEKASLLGNARRYERMFRVFDRARRELVAARGSDRDAGEIIYELGRAALVEHADWLIMRRDRPMKVVLV